ncbi:MAG: GntR family transcriptional regulator [Acidobacteriota bacterium]
MDIPRGSLSQEVYHRLRQEILFGGLTVGSPLSRRKLAESYKVSVIPVMEALQRLESEGLIESRPRVGTRVRVPSAQDIRDQFVLREALEVQGARIFSERSTRDEQAELLALAKRLDDLDTDIELIAEADRRPLLMTQHRLHIRLHLRVVESSQCPPLIHAFEMNQALVFKWLLDLFPWLTRPQKGHYKLMKMIGARDPEAAEQAIRGHLRAGRARLLGAIEGYYLQDGTTPASAGRVFDAGR